MFHTSLFSELLSRICLLVVFVVSVGIGEERDSQPDSLESHFIDSVINITVTKMKLSLACYVKNDKRPLCYHQGDFDGDGLIDIAVTVKNSNQNGMLFILGNKKNIIFGAGMKTRVIRIDDSRKSNTFFGSNNLNEIYNWRVLHSDKKEKNIVRFPIPAIDTIFKIPAAGIKGDGLLLDYDNVYYLFYSNGPEWYFLNIGF